MMAPAMLTGLILAGGQARRMQASLEAAASLRAPLTDKHAPDPLARDLLGTTVDKGLLDLCGEPLVAHAQRFLAPHVQTVLISANRNEQVYAKYGKVMADDAALGDSLGPLAGVERALAMSRTPWVMVLPVDVVNLPADLAPKLLAAVDAHAVPIAYARSPERAHPLCMVLHVRLAGSLRRYLAAGDRKVQLWQNEHEAMPVVFQGDGIFFNINTPAELAYASQCWKS